MEGDSSRVLVAMSGGVDSSVAAALLKEQGHDVVGVFMRNGVSAGERRAHRQGCCGVEDAIDARRVADRLDIPFYALDFEEAFSGLIDDFAAAYSEGRTPNPCIECNRRFKMGSLSRLAAQLGARAVATGHYASLVDRGGRRAVRRGRDHDKDQSYVLFALEQSALGKTALPLGDLRKEEVREAARRLDLPVADKPESMEICFVPTGDYRDVVREHRPESFTPGPILTRGGEVLGHHGGTANFTIGQRRGLPGGQGAALYVQEIRPEDAAVVVGPRLESLASRFLVEGVVWQGAEPLGVGGSLSGHVKIRSQHTPVPAEVWCEGEDRLRVETLEAQHAVAPGQAAVLYDEDGVILVGGWIARERAAEV